jgi:hypothetical protein
METFIELRPSHGRSTIRRAAAIVCVMKLSPIRFFTLAALLGLAAGFSAVPASAEGLNCLISRGNLCFHTGCDNRGKSQRITLNLGTGNFRLCPNRFNETGCIDIPMQFDIRDNAIIGTTLEGPEFSARSVFVNRVTGAMTSMLVTAGGVAAVDFGSCEVRR